MQSRNTSYNLIFSLTFGPTKVGQRKFNTSRFINEINLWPTKGKAINNSLAKSNLVSGLENHNKKIISNVLPIFKETNLKPPLNITVNSRYFFLKRLKFKDEKKILQLSKLKKHLNRK